MLELNNVTRKVGSETYLEGINLTLRRGELTILLGPTLSGKTSLMRVMAGLDKPDSGSVLVDGVSVAGVPVQRRNVAMVYQQFINYPTLTVEENIASPLIVAGVPEDERRRRGAEIAELLQLTPQMQRRPAALSGGQQQRVALARALIKRADLVLLDEPLANLDYKLREELRVELPRLFADMGSMLVYATTEPSEALILGGNTVCLSAGRVVESGPTMRLYRSPRGLLAARLFSDPPLNSVPVKVGGGMATLPIAAAPFALPVPGIADGDYRIAVRAHFLQLAPPSPDAIELRATVKVTELSGSESFVHFDCGGEPWVALLAGNHNLEPGATISLYVSPAQLMVFDSSELALTRVAA